MMENWLNSESPSHDAEEVIVVGSPLQTVAARLELRVRFAFALLTCLGGLILASGTENDVIPVIAVFFSVFGFLFVDWLKIFAIPVIAAYGAMAVAAFYCISDFMDLEALGNHQMNAVAQLLVSVQAIMMLQRKTRKVLEQLGMFCLLELVVSAIFNDAITYGLLMVPLCIVGGWALTLLVAVASTEQMTNGSVLDEDGRGDSIHPDSWGPGSTVIQSHSVSSAESLLTHGTGLPKVTLLTIGPSIVLVGLFFFYGIPRTIHSTRNASRGNAVVGFSDEMRLEQIGEMAQSNQVAARIKFRNPVSQDNYKTVGNLYVRGAVLERYSWQSKENRAIGTWKAASHSGIETFPVLPLEHFPSQNASSRNFDRVDVEVICEASRTKSLFAVAPYHRHAQTRGIRHESNRWCLSRSDRDQWAFPRIRYSFGTHAFQNHVQTSIIANTPAWDHPKQEGLASDKMAESSSAHLDAPTKRFERYRSLILEFDSKAMGTIETLANSIHENAREEEEAIEEYDLARMMERYFSVDGRYRYSLNLDSKSVPGMDPIEQFVAVDRKGHCQYYASALAMMLRSQGIPARLIVGFRTHEYHDISNHFIARQSHAHAWVEALIDSDEMTNAPPIDGQPEADSFWVRLDPTPPGLLIDQETTHLSQIADAAQSGWDDYVVEMDAAKQEATFLGASGDSTLQTSYSQFIKRISNSISQIRFGGNRRGSRLGRSDFFWSLAVAGVIFCAVVVLLSKWRRPRWRYRGKGKTLSLTPRPTIAFYEQTLLELERLGVERSPHQTPEDVRAVANAQPGFPGVPLTQPLDYLTRTFYNQRFGRGLDARESESDAAPIENALQELHESITQMIQKHDLPNVSGTSSPNTSSEEDAS